MTRALMVVGAAVLAGTALLGQQRPAAASLDKARLEAAINKEVIDGDLKAAIAMYRELTHSTDRAVAAQSYLRLGQGYRRLGDPQAKPTLQRALEFKDQPQVVAKARAALGLRAQSGGGANAPSMRRVWAGKGVDMSGSVSLDGRHVAFVDPDTGDLAVRDLEAGVSRRLTANADAHWNEFADSIAFSPDGQQIAFVWFGANKRYQIRIVDAKGVGAPTARTLVDRQDVQWILVTDWSRDGRTLSVVYRSTPQGDTRLATLSVSDGTLKDLRAVDSSSTRALFSPDGRFIAFDAMRNKGTDDRDIVIRNLLDQTESYVASAPAYDSLMGWSPDGTMLVFASDRSGVNALWAAAVRDGKASGEPRMVYANAGDHALGVTTRGAIVVGLYASRLEVNMVGVDTTTGKRLGEPEQPLRRIGATRGPMWSPDGTQLAFTLTARRQGQGRSLGIHDLRTGQVRELRTSMQQVNFPRWSPDGRALLVQGEDADGQYGIFRVSVDTGDVARLASEGYWPSWSADGQRIYFARPDADKKAVTFERDLATGREREIPETRDGSPGIASPDGRYLLQTFQKGKGSELRLLPVAGGEARVVHAVQEGGLPWANWTPDSKHILVKHVGNGRDDVLLVPVDGGAPKKLDLPGARWGWMAMHPDGKRIAYLAGQQEEEVWVIENVLPTAQAVSR